MHTMYDLILKFQLSHFASVPLNDAGLPSFMSMSEAFDSAAQREATAADFSWTQDLGIAGFPTLLAENNGQLALLTNGYQPLDTLQPLLARWLERVAHA